MLSMRYRPVIAKALFVFHMASHFSTVYIVVLNVNKLTISEFRQSLKMHLFCWRPRLLATVTCRALINVLLTWICIVKTVSERMRFRSDMIKHRLWANTCAFNTTLPLDWTACCVKSVYVWENAEKYQHSFLRYCWNVSVFYYKVFGQFFLCCVRHRLWSYDLTVLHWCYYYYF